MKILFRLMMAVAVAVVVAVATSDVSEPSSTETTQFTSGGEGVVQMKGFCFRFPCLNRCGNVCTAGALMSISMEKEAPSLPIAVIVSYVTYGSFSPSPL